MQLDVFERNNAKRFNVKYQQLLFNKKKRINVLMLKEYFVANDLFIVEGDHETKILQNETKS
jgi:hypothetical protein